jgi:hypothetical protein
LRMAMTDTAGLRRLASRIAGFGLEGWSAEPLGVTDRAWSPLLSTLALERLTGLAMAAVDDGWLSLPGDLAEEELLESQGKSMLWSLSLERKLVTLAEVLESARIDVVVLKGPVLAHTLYPDPSWRPFGDLDLLVRTRDWDRTTALLGTLGMRRRLPEPRPGFDKRFGKAAAFIDRDGAEVDLHRTLTPGPFGLWIDTDELVDRAVSFEIGGRRLRRLDDTAVLLHASMHASLGWRPPLLWTLRDVAESARSGRVDWRDLGALAARWRVSAVLAHAFRATRSTLGAKLPAEAASFATATPRRRERRLLESYTTDRRRRGGTALATVQALPDLRSRASYVWAMLVPNREFMATRTGSPRPSYLRRWGVPLRWLGRRGSASVGR